MIRRTKSQFKRVPALDKCFAILDLLARSKQPLGISSISKALSLNKSSVFNIVHTLADLEVLEFDSKSKLRFGTRLHVLGNASSKGAELIRNIHPFLEEASKKSGFSVFLGVRQDLKAIIIDKVDAPFDLKVSAEVGMRIPLLAGAGGKALLSQLTDQELDKILSENELKKFTPSSCVDKVKFREEVIKVRKEGVAYDWEEYIEGIVAVAVAVNTHRPDLQTAIWAVGLKRQASIKDLPKVAELLRKIVDELDTRFTKS